MYKKKEGRQKKTNDKIDFYFSNVNVFEMFLIFYVIKSIHLETDLEEEHEQKHHN